ncbi:MAG TPA: hypothetical protein VIU15_21190, partial [Streptomyces sp.]
VDPPVLMHPNSRFGIGVLSYFMLADEFTVTTCRMGLDGRPGPVLRASIHGPGHLFRIVTAAERGDEPGTRVRLYLRKGAEVSSVDVLERLLGIAEFDTVAEDESRRTHWTAGVTRERKQPRGERFGLDAHGARVTWVDAPPGVQLTWTEHGGALLVDGLVVQPARRTGVVSSAASGLTGVVVNLSGPYAPAQLSTDRAEILDDVEPALNALLARAVDPLIAADGTTLPNFAWICRVAQGSTQLADLVTHALLRAERPLPYGNGVLDVARCGVLPSDGEILRGEGGDDASWWFSGSPPDHIYLWRLLAHKNERILNQLTSFCPELDDAQPVLPAMPSDQLLLTEPPTSDLMYWSWVDPRFPRGGFLPSELRGGASLDAAIRRAAVLGLHDLRTEGIPAALKASDPDLRLLCDSSGRRLRRSANVTVTELVRKSVQADKEPKEVAALWRDLGINVPGAVGTLADAALHDELLAHDPQRPMDWFSPGETVPPGRLAQAAIDLNITVSEVCARYEAYGLRPDRAALPERPERQLPIILRRGCQDKEAWLTRTDPMAPVQLLLAAHMLDMTPTEALSRYRELGFSPPCPFPDNATTDDLALLDSRWVEDPLRLAPPGPLPYDLLLESGAHRLGPAIRRFEDYGFDVPLRAPHHPDELDEQLLSLSGPCSWFGLSVGDTMPFAYLVGAARSLLRPPAELAERMATYGVTVSCPDLPAGLSAADAHELLRDSKYDETYISASRELTWQDLLGRAAELNANLEQVVRWLAELGISMPDIGEQLRRALAQVPRPLGVNCRKG